MTVSELWDISVKDEPGMHIYPGDPAIEVRRVRAIASGDAANLTHLACGVKTLGMDYLSIEQFGSKDFPVHKRLLGRGVLIIEGLDLSTVSAGTYTLVCLPLNLQGVDGAPARAILMR